MTFSYSKPQCIKGTKLIKSRCECKTQKKAPKIRVSSLLTVNKCGEAFMAYSEKKTSK